MLEAHFYSSSGKRELAQAITTLPSTPTGECLHVSQIWCLVVNGSTMVTSGRQSIDALRGETIARTVGSIRHNDMHIKVSLGSDRSWSIPVTTNTSWPAFLAVFGEKVAGMEAQGASAKFEYNKQVIDGKLWHELLEAAKTSTVEVTMQDVHFHITEADEQMIEQHVQPDDDDDATIGADDNENANHADGTEHDQEETDLPNPVQPTALMPLKPTLNLQLFKHVESTADMRSLADSLHKILLSNDRTTENTAYRQCPKAKLSDINMWLNTDSDPKERNLRSKGSQLLRKPKRRIVCVARYLFRIFWPVDFEHPMTDRFWGALNKILGREDEFYAQVRNLTCFICI
jgi:hypothetical protein